MAKYSKKAQEKIEEVMHEYKHGELKSGKGGKGGVVKSREQAIAIGISEDTIRYRIHKISETCNKTC